MLDEVTPEAEQSAKTNAAAETSTIAGIGGKIHVPQSGTYRAVPQSQEVNRKQLQTPEIENTEQILPVLSARTSSLDIEIPYTGKTFLFTASQGSLDLSFRTISNRTGSRGVQMLAALFGLAFLYGIYRICFNIGNRLTFDRRTHRNIAGLITLLSILSLILAPLVSVLSFIFAVILWITLFQRKSTTRT
jgi:hypothetical protein